MCGNKNCHMTTNANDHGYFSDKTSIEGMFSYVFSVLAEHMLQCLGAPYSVRILRFIDVLLIFLGIILFENIQ